MIFLIPLLCLCTRAERPNVILILADDLGIGDLSLMNSLGKIKTPNIDRLGNEGVNFYDAHSASSRCAPSRYMLMTGRYSLNNKDPRNRVLDPGAPHIGEMFKRNGYRTGILGKPQPIMEEFKDDLSPAESLEIRTKQQEYQKTWGGGTGIKSPQDKRKSFFTPANYTMKRGAHTSSYDYSLLNNDPCCRVGGGYFENGLATEPFTKYAFQQPYPEGTTLQDQKCDLTFTGEKRCTGRHFANGYLAPPHSDKPIPGPILVPKMPAYMLVQESYDSTLIEQRLAEGAIKFIRESANKPDPFFLFYATRGGHNPFNSPASYRNTTDAGLIGEAVAELDDIVGRLLDELKELNIDDNTLVVFMSDNGAINTFNAKTAVKTDGSGDYMWDMYRHYQNSIDFNGKNHKLNGGKASCYEGGHRVPFLWRYPGLIKTPKVIYDSTVSYMDIYRTMADMIGEKLNCNEAPDSRSIWDVINGTGTLTSPIIHHCIYQGGAAIRQNEWKLIPGTKELFNLKWDLEEQKNLYDSKPIKVEYLTERFETMTKAIADREEKSQQGLVKDKCFKI